MARFYIPVTSMSDAQTQDQSQSHALPAPAYLTADLPGIGGVIKEQLGDFCVEEIAGYPFDGVGTHCYLKVEKRGFSTMAAADILAKALGRRNIDVGYAGLKDKQAVTSQWFSVEHLDSDRARALQSGNVLPPGMKVLEFSRHRNKIKRGHLAGNRFSIRIRNPEWTRIGGETLMNAARERAEAILAVLLKAGAPNFFGPQRFGMRRDNHLLGMALITGNSQDFVNRFLGDPDPSVDHGQVLRARQHFAKGELDAALSLWPGHLRDERRALSALAKGKGNPRRALFAINIELKKLLVSALQSFLFNKVLDRRLPKLGVVLPGDFCTKHENGASFPIGPNPEDAVREQPRADAHEISPTGPLFGHRMSAADSVVKIMEDQVLQESGMTPAQFDPPADAPRPPVPLPPGGRRSLRFFAEGLAISTETDARGPHFLLRFTLPPGSYATVLLGEIMKSDVAID